MRLRCDVGETRPLPSGSTDSPCPIIANPRNALAIVAPMDPMMVSGALAAVLGANQASRALTRLLGPAADEVADALKRFTEYRLRNVGRISEIAGAKVNETVNAYTAPPRLVMQILDPRLLLRRRHRVGVLRGRPRFVSNAWWRR